MKKAIIVGATSGIGKEMAKLLVKKHYIVGITGRRLHLLTSLKKDIGKNVYIKHMDISKTDAAIKVLNNLIKEMNGMNIIIISSAVLHSNKQLDWSQDKETIDVNVSGFIAIANAACKHFIKQGHGHLVGISSIASLKSSRRSTAYTASKAFISNYMKGLRHKLNKLGKRIYITDIQPGLVDTPMINLKKGFSFWVMTPKTAAEYIYTAIRKKKKTIIITKRWNLIGLLLKILPDSIKGKV